MFKTTAAYFSGAICGNLWWPVGELAGSPMQANCRGPWGFWQEGDGWTFRDALLSLLMHKGGDFQNALFAADSEIVIERKRITGPGKYQVHIKRIEIAKVAPDLVNPEAFSGDFFGDE